MFKKLFYTLSLSSLILINPVELLYDVGCEPCVGRIPGRMMLDLLLEELVFTAARYSRRGYLSNTMSSFTGVRSSDEAAAEDLPF